MSDVLGGFEVTKSVASEVEDGCEFVLAGGGVRVDDKFVTSGGGEVWGADGRVTDGTWVVGGGNSSHGVWVADGGIAIASRGRSGVIHNGILVSSVRMGSGDLGSAG